MGGGGWGGEAQHSGQLATKRLFSPALQACQLPAMLGDEDLEDEDEEDEDDEDSEDGFLTAGSQVSCLLIGAQLARQGFPWGACPLLSWRPRAGSTVVLRPSPGCELGCGCRKCQVAPAPGLWAVVPLSWGRAFPGHRSVLLVFATAHSPARCSSFRGLALPQGQVVPLPWSACPLSRLRVPAEPLRLDTSAHAV